MINLSIDGEKKIILPFKRNGSLKFNLNDDTKIVLPFKENNLQLGFRDAEKIILNLDNENSIKLNLSYGEGIKLSLGGNIGSFINLTDTPTTYLGQSGKVATVNSTEDGLEFAEVQSETTWGEIVGTLSDQEDLQNALDGKVDKIDGKGLSTNDYTNAEKSKLAGIEEGAEVNVVTSVSGKIGDVTLDKTDVGLSNVDNTSDLDKPVSTATQAALDLKTDESDFLSHTGDTTIHFTEGSISHENIQDVGINTHLQIDSHIEDNLIHFTEDSIDHQNIQNIGTNTHEQIDSHISNTSNPHSVTLTELQDVNGTPLTTNGQLLIWDNDNSYFDFTENINDYLKISDAATYYAKLDGTNQPFTGNLEISKVGPEIRLTDSGTDEDYSINFDGSNAIHTLTSGDFVFNGGYVGIGVTPLFKLHVKSDGVTSINTQACIQANTGDCGLFLGEVAGSVSFMSGGSYRDNSGDWIPCATYAATWAQLNGDHYFYSNTGLTAGVAYTPSLGFVIGSSANTSYSDFYEATNIHLYDDSGIIFLGESDDQTIGYNSIIDSIDISKLTINNAFTFPISDGTTNYFLQTDGSGNISWSNVDLTSDVTGLLPTANGGTNESSWTQYSIPYLTSSTQFGESSELGFNPTSNSWGLNNFTNNFFIGDDIFLYLSDSEVKNYSNLPFMSSTSDKIISKKYNDGSESLVRAGLFSSIIGITGTSSSLNYGLNSFIYVVKNGGNYTATGNGGGLVAGRYGIRASETIESVSFTAAHIGGVSILPIQTQNADATITDLFAYQIESGIDQGSSGSLSITNFYGLLDQTKSVRGSVSNYYGIYLENQTDADITNKSAIVIAGDNYPIILGSGLDASLYYDGTNFVINPKLVGSGNLNVKGQILVEDKIAFTQTDGNEYIDSLADGYLDFGATTQHRFNNTVNISGGNIRSITTKTNDYTILSTDYTILVDATSNTVTLTLPASPNEGQIYNLKCIDDTNTVTIVRNGKTIDGDASDLVLIEDETVTLQADSSGNWWII